MGAVVVQRIAAQIELAVQQDEMSRAVSLLTGIRAEYEKFRVFVNEAVC